MKIYNMEQGTKEWKDVRKLKFTASNASTIIANGKGLQTLVDEMLAEYYSSGKFEEYTDEYKNYQMKRGNDFEDKARTIYELETGNKVEQVGFIELNDRVGVSPDGLIGDDGLIEIKNHSDKVFLKLAETQKIDKKYLDQMQMQMFVSGRAWCDYFAFNPNFNPCYIKIRVNKDIDVFKAIVEGLQSGRAILEQKKAELDKLFEIDNERTNNEN